VQYRAEWQGYRLDSAPEHWRAWLRGLAAGAAAGAAAGSVVPVVGTIIGAAVGMLASRYAGSSKDKGQMRRDAVRGALQERGLLDENWRGTLADGSTTDFGKDGSVLENRSNAKDC
jgi:hypothetical protein